MVFPTNTNRRIPYSLIAVATFVFAVTVGCNSPTAPTTSPVVAAPLQLLDATVFFGGRSVNGSTVTRGQTQGDSTLFQAKLTSGSGPALGRTVQVQYQRPGPGMMGSPSQGTMHLYDDGTHGDPIAGDGIYCFEDFDGLYGFQFDHCPMGQYLYDFYGIDQNGNQSNHMKVRVTLAEDSTTAATSSLQLSNAQVKVNDQVVNGTTMQPGQGKSTFFQATLTDPNGPALGRRVQVEYQRPGMGMMMGGGLQGTMYLYDDGTHGDLLPGDGIYCYEDIQGLYGFHYQGCAMGLYYYDFYGIGQNGAESNRMQVRVTIR